MRFRFLLDQNEEHTAKLRSALHVLCQNLCADDHQKKPTGSQLFHLHVAAYRPTASLLWQVLPLNARGSMSIN